MATAGVSTLGGVDIYYDENVGRLNRDEHGKLVPLDVKKGDKVLFGKWSGTEVKVATGPVVKTIRLAPEATWPVTLQGS